jgi:hypothetical protein
MLWCLCQKLVYYSLVDLCLGLLICFTGLHVYFCSSTMLFLLLWLCSIVWSQVLWYLLNCLFCSVLPWLFMVFCTSVWTSVLIFQSRWGMSLQFWWGLYWWLLYFFLQALKEDVPHLEKLIPDTLVSFTFNPDASSPPPASANLTQNYSGSTDNWLLKVAVLEVDSPNMAPWSSESPCSICRFFVPTLRF